MVTSDILGQSSNLEISNENSFLDSKSSYTQDIVNTCKSKKNANITPNIAFQMMLNCIPTVSSKISERLSSKYDNLNSFLICLSKFSSKEEAEQFIINIKTDDETKVLLAMKINDLLLKHNEAIAELRRVKERERNEPGLVRFIKSFFH